LLPGSRSANTIGDGVAADPYLVARDTERIRVAYLSAVLRRK